MNNESNWKLKELPLSFDVESKTILKVYLRPTLH